jgi:phospholipase A1
MVGLNVNENFSQYNSNYFIFGQDDLKLQFSFKYRLSKPIPIYLGYTQNMFWNIYNGSQPFRDINYHPETFYRIIDKNNNAFKTLDIGYLHSSNGKKDTESRSLNRVFLRTNYITRFDRHNLNFNLMIFKIYNSDQMNNDIVNHIGYWDLKIAFTDLIVHKTESIDLEMRFYAGKRVTDLKNGAYQLGLIYNFASEYLNPAIYFQHFQGYSENLLEFNKRHSDNRLGILLSY